MTAPDTTGRATRPVLGGLGLLLVGIALLLALSGTPAAVAVIQAVIVTIQAATGMAIWLLVRRSAVTIVELLGMGLALGTIVCLLGGVLLQPVTMWGWIVPSVLVAVLAALLLPSRGAGVRVDGAELRSVAITLAATVALLAFYVVRSPIPTDRITDTVHPDLPFFETLMNGLSTFGAGDNLLMSQTQIRYHWLSYAWAGQLDVVSAAPAFQVLTRTAPLIGCLTLALIAVAWARRMSSVSWVPTVAGLLVVLSGFVGARFGVLTNLDSPSALFSLMWLMALCVALFAYLARDAGGWMLLVLLLLGAATTGGKVSAGVIAVLGVGLVALAGLLRREPHARRAVVAAVAVGLGAALAYLLLISGVDVAGNIGVGSASEKAAVFQGLLPFSGPLGVLLGTAFLALATLPRLAGLLPLVLDPQWRWRPEVVFTLGTVAASALALFILSEGINDLWFILAASGPACVVAAVGVGLAAPDRLPAWRGWDARWITVVGSAAIVGAVVLVARTADPYQGVRVWGLPLITIGLGLLLAVVVARGAAQGSRTMPLLALAVIAMTTMGLLGRAFEFSDGSSQRPTWPTAEIATPAPDTSGADQASDTPQPVFTGSRPPAPDLDATDVWQAGAWVAANVPADGILAQNYPESLDLTTLSGHRAYLAGARYQVGLGAASSAAEVPVRAAVSVGLDSGPTAESLAALCSAGVGWLWLETPASADAWAGVAEPVFTSPTVSVLALGPGACEPS